MNFKILEKIQKDIEAMDKLKVVKTKDGEVYRIPYTENDICVLLGYQAQIMAAEADILSEILEELTKLTENKE